MATHGAHSDDCACYDCMYAMAHGGMVTGTTSGVAYQKPWLDKGAMTRCHHCAKEIPCATWHLPLFCDECLASTPSAQLGLDPYKALERRLREKEHERDVLRRELSLIIDEQRAHFGRKRYELVLLAAKWRARALRAEQRERE